MFKFPELSGDILATDDREMEQTSRGDQTYKTGGRKASGTVWSMLSVRSVIAKAYYACESNPKRAQESMWVSHASGKRRERNK